MSIVLQVFMDGNCSDFTQQLFFNTNLTDPALRIGNYNATSQRWRNNTSQSADDLPWMSVHSHFLVLPFASATAQTVGGFFVQRLWVRTVVPGRRAVPHLQARQIQKSKLYVHPHTRLSQGFRLIGPPSL